MQATVAWLEKYGVRYDALRFRKMPADLYIDDRAFNPTKLAESFAKYQKSETYRIITKAMDTYP